MLDQLNQLFHGVRFPEGEEVEMGAAPREPNPVQGAGNAPQFTAEARHWGAPRSRQPPARTCASTPAANIAPLNSMWMAAVTRYESPSERTRHAYSAAA